MPASLATLADLVRGQLVGDGSIPITKAVVLRDAASGGITFIDHADKLPQLLKTSASAAVVPRGVVPSGMPVIQVDDVQEAFRTIVLHFRPQRIARRVGISPAAAISPTAKLAEDVDVHPCATIGEDVVVGRGTTIHSGAHVMAGCQLGEDVTIFPSAVLYEGTIVGSRSMIHAGAVIGAHGFGYKLVDGRHRLAAQLGHVEIQADVEVGAGTTIDRGTYGPTVIGEGTKIDNQVMIAHNCRIGRHNLLCSQVGIAGSTSTGDYVVMAGQVGVRDHVHIGDRAIISAQSGVSNDIPAGVCVLGSPAVPLRDQKLNLAVFSKLPEMRRQLKALERTVAGMQAPAGGNQNAAA
jgi:UDP-3-O-[3-hydroxymyristoyl] glucosamine N-acyltransferase